MACLWHHQPVSAIPLFQAGEFSLELGAALPVAPAITVASVAEPPGTDIEEDPEPPDEAVVEPEEKEPEVIQLASETQRAPAVSAPPDVSRNPDAQAAAPISGALNPGVPNAPRLDSYIRPIYPPGARLRGEEGAVTVSALVTPSGKARTVEVVRSSGFPALDQSALNAVLRARFIPARTGHTAIESQTTLTFRFTLLD
ncbi:MAG: TonB family protein [Verrucomicrobia bacterium]|nr:TonB family protein [Verrucomicrobiota bacterium]